MRLCSEYVGIRTETTGDLYCSNEHGPTASTKNGSRTDWERKCFLNSSETSPRSWKANLYVHSFHQPDTITENRATEIAHLFGGLSCNIMSVCIRVLPHRSLRTRTD